MESFDSNLFLADTSTLRLSDSVGVIIKTPDGKYLLQHRWNRPGFYFPGFWGLFGGGVKKNETPKQAANREILEELGLNLESFELAMDFEFDFRPIGLKRIRRWFYLASISDTEIRSIKLSEGLEARAFTSADALGGIRLVHYDAFAIWSLESRLRLI